MSPSERTLTKLLEFLKQWTTGDNSGVAMAAVGIVLLAIGMLLEAVSLGLGTLIRVLGGLLLLTGIVAFIFATPHRRDITIGTFKSVVRWYTTRTAHWRWMNRIGLAAVIIGLAWLVPVLALRIIFGRIALDLAATIMVPGIIIFWAGVGLLIYGIYRAIKDARATDDSYRSHEEGRSKRRF